MDYRFPKDTPKFTEEVLRETVSGVHSILGDGLIGVYLYGSLAMGCFQPGISDLDMLFVVRKKTSREERRRLIEFLKGACSKDRRIELSVVRKGVVRRPRYPMMVDLHYEYWGNTFENEEDREILSNLYTAGKRGFCVWGAPISEVFSRIPAQYYLRSVMEDLEHTRRHLHENPERAGYNITVYWILSSCRVLAFVRDKQVRSKLEGGRWGLANLPQKYHTLIEKALSAYQGEKKEEQTWNQKDLQAFADFMTEAISRESKTKKQ